MLIKAGVDISRLERNTRRGLQKADDLFDSNGQEIVITSTYEGNHGAGSLHYANQAFDIRKPRINPVLRLSQLSGSLGNDFDVIVESDHIHIEYDPKPGDHNI